jgi:hypothetical protein
MLGLFGALSALLMLVPDKPEIVIAIGIGLIGALSIVHWPVMATYMAVLVTILFDVLPSTYAHTFIADLGIFRNLSSVGLPDAVVVSLFEVVVALALAASLFQRFHQRRRLARGPLFWPLIGFGSMVVFGELQGLVSGGDFTISLWEIRPLLYMVLLYVLSVNTVSKPVHLRVVLWITVLAIAARCVEGVYRYFQIPADTRVSVQTVLEHEDSLFLAITLGLLVGAMLWRRWLPKQLLPVLLVMMPLVGYVMIINHRRAVYVCAFLVVLTVLPLVWTGLRSAKQRKLFIYAIVLSSVLGSLYTAAFWNRGSSIGKPAQAVRSIFDPDDRDYASNMYREFENENLRFTIELSPLVGIGFGKPMQVVRWIVDLSESWAMQLYMPHNNMLWLWMRMGIIGFIMFWMTIGAGVLLITGSVKLSATRLLALIKEESDLKAAVTSVRETSGESANRSQQAPTGGIGTNIRLSATPERSQYGRLRSLRVEMQDCAYLLIFSLLAQSVVAALLVLTVVDQGMMSFRLTAYVGAILGTLAAAWEMHKVRFRPSPEMDIKELQKWEEDSGVNRRRVRYFAGATSASE